MLQKNSGYNTTAFGPSTSGSTEPTDAESFGLAVPLAAIALASYGGYTLANKASDAKAAAERRKRIQANINRLSKTNLEVLQTVRKEAGLAGTMFNPFQGIKGIPGSGDSYVPNWFRPSTTTAAAPAPVDALAFKTLALAATYGTGAAALKYVLGSLERQRELESGNKKITEAVKAGSPVVSPDPFMDDETKEERERMLGLQENVLLKESAEGDRGTVAQWLYDKNTGTTDRTKGSAWGTTKAAVLMIALGAFGTGAVLTKRWADDRDPNRQRIKAAEAAAKRMALQERPPAIIGNIDPTIKDQLDSHIRGGSLRVRPALETGSLEDQVQDPTDSLSKNIATV